jgi:hypothetical protein
MLSGGRRFAITVSILALLLLAVVVGLQVQLWLLGKDVYGFSFWATAASIVLGFVSLAVSLRHYLARKAD